MTFHTFTTSSIKGDELLQQLLHRGIGSRTFAVYYIDLSNYCTFAHVLNFIGIKEGAVLIVYTYMHTTKIDLLKLEPLRPGPFN